MRQEAVTLLQKLVRIDSCNPPGNETKIIAFIKKYLAGLGVASRIYEFKKNRPNLVCRLKSKHPRKSLLLTPHVDTVPLGGNWKYPALSGTVRKGKLYGRGATDCKSNVAVVLALIARLRREKIQLEDLDLVFAFCADEETGSHYGTKPLMKKLKDIDYGVVLDADEFDIVIAQKGLLHLRVELFGKAAHGAYLERGISAVEKGARIINALKAHKFKYALHRLLIKPTLNVGRFAGGEKVNMVADRAFLELDIRWLPGMTEKNIIADIKKIIAKEKIPYCLKVMSAQKPIEISSDSPHLAALKKVLVKNRVPVKLRPSFGATVLNYLTDQGIEAFAFGFGSRNQAHSANEYVRIKNLEKGVQILLDYILSF